MRWNYKSGQDEDRSRQTLIGVFPNQIQASRALVALHEHAFVAEHDTLGPAPAEPAARASSAVTRGTGNWFGELRQIYHEDTAATPESVVTGSRLARYDISPDQTRILDRDFGPDASIVAVEPTDRWEEALSLLKKFGARIVGEDTGSAAGTSLRTEVAGSVPTAATAPAVVSPAETASPATQSDEFAPARTGTTAPVYGESKAASAHPELASSNPELSSQASPAPVVNSAPFEPPRSAEPGYIQLFGEELRIHKEKVNNADVRVRKETVTRMETVQVPVTREHLVVEHTDGSPLGREGEIRIPLSEERVRIDKEMRLHEEYKASKRQVTESESVTEPVRKERLLIDQPGDEPQK